MREHKPTHEKRGYAPVVTQLIHYTIRKMNSKPAFLPTQALWCIIEY